MSDQSVIDLALIYRHAADRCASNARQAEDENDSSFESGRQAGFLAALRMLEAVFPEADGVASYSVKVVS